MKAAGLKTGLTKYSLAANTFKQCSFGIACGAQTNTSQYAPLAPNTPAAAPDLSAIAASANGETPVSPQLQAAADRVTVRPSPN